MQRNPVFFAAPDVASSLAPPVGRLWSLPPTDAPSVTSYTEKDMSLVLIVSSRLHPPARTETVHVSN